MILYVGYFRSVWLWIFAIEDLVRIVPHHNESEPLGVSILETSIIGYLFLFEVVY